MSARLRRLTATELPAAHRLSSAVGWPHRLEDWQFALAHGDGLGVFAPSGELIGTTLWWLFGERFATLGLVIVEAGHQGHGIGRALLDRSLETIGPRSIVLNATQAAQKLYTDGGFAPLATVRQLQGAAFAVPMTPLRAGERIRPLGRADHARLVAMDAGAIGMPRGTILAPLIAAAEGVALDRDGEMTGFALFRRFGRGHVVGPVVAPDDEGAKALIGHWLASSPGLFVRVDVPAQAGAVAAWLTELGLSPAGDVTTMVRGSAPVVAPDCRRYALVSQALG